MSAGWLHNSRSLKRSLDEEDIANLTREELYEIFWKSNLSFAIEPPPPSESGSGDVESGDVESGVTCITLSTLNVLLEYKGHCSL